MNKILFILLISSIGHGQHQLSEPTFYSEIAERVSPKNYYNLKHQVASKVVVMDTIFMANSEKWIEKNIYSFKTPKEFVVKKYRNSEFVADELVKLDSRNRIVDYEGNLKYEGGEWYITKFRYFYKNKKKIKEKINESGETYMRYTVKYDKRKNPILIKNEIVRTNSTKIQTVDYDYANHKFTLMNFNYQSQLDEETKGHINSDYVISKNSHGDVSKMYWVLTDIKEPFVHEILYTYDDKGNWIKMIKNVINPDGSMKPYHRTYRKITYKN